MQLKQRGLTLLFNILIAAQALGQAPYTAPPDIKYQSPQQYYVGLPITALQPQNAGGAVPATIYGTVTTLAGNGAPGNTNGTGASASFNSPAAIAVDINNNVYVADAGSNMIRKITPAGVVTTYAGTGTYATQNGTALTASFKKPSAIAVDLNGNVYVADQDDGLIRKINPGGDVSTLTGTLTQGFANGPPATASFKLVTGMVADKAGNLYAVDNGNNMIRKITPAGNVTTLAGSLTPGNADGNGATARFDSPTSIAIDVAGNLLVTDFNGNTIRKINTLGDVITFAGSGLAGNADGQNPVASFSGPHGIGVDPTDNIYVADENNFSIRRSGTNKVVVLIAGNNIAGNTDGVFTTARFNRPGSMVYDYAGNLILAESQNNKIRKITVTGYTINRELPAGLVFDHQTGIITGTPTAKADAADYVITAYNAGGSYTTSVNIRVDPITLDFSSIPGKTTCDVDFSPIAVTNIGTITYTSDKPSVATIVNGKIHIVGVGGAVITANNGYITTQQVLIVNSPAQPAVILSTPNNTPCQGTLVSYTATATNAGTAPTYQWQLNGTATGGNSPDYSSASLQNGDVISCIVTNNEGCLPTASLPASATVNLKSKVAIAVNIRPSVSDAVCPGTAITFTATTINVPDVPFYSWQVNGKNAGDNSPTFTGDNFANGDQVTCTITSTNDCLISSSASSAPVTVSVLDNSACVTVIPNTFTPNGDGFNDTWNFIMPAGFNNAVVSIYNRYGGIVFQSKGYGKPWDGSMAGQLLPAGTYYYLIAADDPRKKLSGSVTIIR